MQRINQDIKTGQFQQIYLLMGEEDYLRNQYKNRLKAALLGDGDQMNLNLFKGKEAVPQSIIDMAETMPFLAERRVIVLEDTGLLKSSQEMLAEYLKEPAATAFFIISEKEVDKRGKLYKAIRQKGYACEFGEQDENTLKKWIRQTVAKENKQMEERALALFLNKTGTDMSGIRTELEKLLCYCMDKDVISMADVEDMTTERITNRIFDMIRAVAERKQKQALDLYYDLLALKEPPMRILALLARQFQMLLLVKGLVEKGHDSRYIGEKAGLQPFIAKKYMEQARSFQSRMLKKAVEECVQAEEDVKTGKLNDIISIELLIIKFSSLQMER
ncbi:MAG: DNA polymerase III subunit delta [Lachnospiraceae bacterium]|nr:DNA polymerase III subunit delta [Lachnospiraceae bacterium]